MISLFFAGKYGDLNKFCKVQLGEGVNAILKKVGLYLQMTRILSATQPILLNLLANQSLDIVLSSDKMV